MQTEATLTIMTVKLLQVEPPDPASPITTYSAQTTAAALLNQQKQPLTSTPMAASKKQNQ